MIRRVPWSKDGTKSYFGYLNRARIEFTQAQKEMLDDPTGSLLSGGINMEAAAGNVADYNLFIFNFISPITLTKIGYFITRWDVQKYWQLQYSLDTTNGWNDGTWTNIGSVKTLGYYYYDEYAVTSPEPAQWYRLVQTGSWPFNDFDIYNISLFGEYETEQFELWDSSGSAILDDYPYFVFDPAYSDVDYSEPSSFKIKNLDSVAHTYTVSIIQFTYGGDSFITNYITVSNNSGNNKYASLETDSVAAGNLSETIDVYADLPAINNPKNGIHYWRVSITKN